MHDHTRAAHEQTFTTGEVATLIGVDRSTLLRWLRKGLLAEVERTASNYRVWRPHDVRRALDVWRRLEDARIEQCRTARRNAQARSAS